jgi:hypothetical protein
LAVFRGEGFYLPAPSIGAMLSRSPSFFARPAMSALLIAALYFGSFLAIGLIAKLATDRLTRDTGSLSDIQSQAGTNRRKLKAFLLGAWRNED